MGEQKPITNADLARHWACSPPYVTKLVKTKGMPAFETLAEADAWRTVHAPARKRLTDSAKIGAENGKKIGGAADTTTPASTNRSSGEERSATNNGGGAQIIDVRSFIRPGADFDALMLEQAEGVPQVAHGLYLRACAEGNPLEVAAQLKNWSAAAAAAADVRKRFLDIQESARALIPLDEAMDIIGTELQTARAAMLKLGERTATLANPQDPALAKRVIDASVDDTFKKLYSAVEHAREELGPKAVAS